MTAWSGAPVSFRYIRISPKNAGLSGFAQPSSWLKAFSLHKELVRRSADGKKVIFIDELSWMDTPRRRSGFITALENFWNGWASGRKDVALIVCASATSWMMSKIVHSKGVELNRNQTLECCMIMGDVLYYWNHLQRDKSLIQNIDTAFFAQDAPLKDELKYLYASLFKHPIDYLAIVSALACRKAGMTREEIIEATSLADQGTLTNKLGEFKSCGFVKSYRAFGKKRRDSLYQLMDNYTLFYYKFLENGNPDERYWEN